MRTLAAVFTALALTACQQGGSSEPLKPDQGGSMKVDYGMSDAPGRPDPAGTYTRTAPSAGTLILTPPKDRGEWTVALTAGGVPNGAATAADCAIEARGSFADDRVTATVTSAGGAEGAELGPSPARVTVVLGWDGKATVDDGGAAERYCAMGSDVGGVYVRQP